jgi:hypothetical protein
MMGILFGFQVSLLNAPIRDVNILDAASTASG